MNASVLKLASLAAASLALVAGTALAEPQAGPAGAPRFAFERITKDAPSDRACIRNQGGAIRLDPSAASGVAMSAVLFLPQGVDPTSLAIKASEGWSLAIDEYQAKNRALILHLEPFGPMDVEAGAAVACLTLAGIDARELDVLGFRVSGKIVR